MTSKYQKSFFYWLPLEQLLPLARSIRYATQGICPLRSDTVLLMDDTFAAALTDWPTSDDPLFTAFRAPFRLHFWLTSQN